MSKLENRIAIVTGATSGIGLACATRFASEGAIVIGIDRNEGTQWSSISDLSPASDFHQLDVTDSNALKDLAALVSKQFGRIDVLVTAAGIASRKWIGSVHTPSLSGRSPVITAARDGLQDGAAV